MNQKDIQLVQQRLPRVEDLDKVIARFPAGPQRKALLKMRVKAARQAKAFDRIFSEIAANLQAQYAEYCSGNWREDAKTMDFADMKSDKPTVEELGRILLTMKEDLDSREK